jgi:hypothetical protein
MRLRDDFKDEMEVGFDCPEPGVSIFQIQEGVTEIKKEDSEGISLRIPMLLDTVLEGPDTNHGLTASAFLALVSKEGNKVEFAETQLNFILFATGLTKEFMNKFPEDIEPFDDKFLTGLKLKLPGKLIKVAHDTREFGGRTQFNVKKWMKVGGNDTGATSGGGKPSTDDDWG